MSTTGWTTAETLGATQGGTLIGAIRPSADRLGRLEAWFEAQYPALLRFANYVCGNPATAEDLVQDAFVRLYRVANRIDERTVGAYARTTIVNLSRSTFRSRSREAFAPAPDRGTAAHDPGPRDEVWRALGTLSPRQRAVIALRYYEDLDDHQIAAALGMSHGSVKKHSARALQRLRDVLGRTR